MLLAQTLLDHDEFILASECYTICSDLKHLSDKEKPLWKNRLEKLVLDAVSRSRRGKRLPIYIDNYDEDSGIPEEKFEELNNLSLEKYSLRYHQKINFPFIDFHPTNDSSSCSISNTDDE